MEKQCSAQNQELLDLRAAQLRSSGDSQARPDPLCRLDRGPSRERGAEFHSFRDEFQVDNPTRLVTKVEADAGRLAPKTVVESGDWSFSGATREHSRHKPRASFEAVMGASPLRTRDGECVVRRSRTPSPTNPAFGGRLEENWTFGLRSQESQRRADPLGSARGALLGGRMSLATSPPRSPRTILHSARGPYL